MGRQDRKDTIAAMHRQVIVSTAQELFAEKGIESATMDEIAKRAQYSKRTLYSYFPGKQAILEALVSDGLDKLYTLVHEAVNAQDAFLEKYRAFCRCVLQFYRDHTVLLLTIFDYLNAGEAHGSAEQIVSTQESIYKLLEEIISEGQRQRVTRPGIDAPKTAVLLWQWIGGMIIFAGRRARFLKDGLSSSDQELLQEGFASLVYTLQARYTPFKPL